MNHNHAFRFSTTTNPFSFGNGKGDGSMFGGSVPLPRVDHQSPYPQSKTISFVFTYDHDILNSSVLGPKGRQYFAIGTDVGKHLMSPTTIIQSAEGTHARIEWRQPCPTVEWNGVLENQTTGEFLRLTPDQKGRFMTFGRTQFVWLPFNTSVLLSTGSPSSPEVVACVNIAPYKSTILDIAAESIGQGMLEKIVLAVVLLLSGRRID
ncbi:hypothetical protein DL96DRAFT_1779043 [Flagelloscypha sp. PMI_526]|nr:hypothetical protein DL96DRAFT_1779043 [Flagelloscypha sp. PMI_526]